MGRAARISVFGAIAAVGVVSAPVHAQGGANASALLGAWELQRETPRGTMTSTFTFAQEGDSMVVKVGSGEEAVTVGRVEFDGGAVSFPFDMRAVMAAMRPGGEPPRAGRRRAEGGRAGPGRAGPGGGPPRGDMPEPPTFSGTLQDNEIRGAFAGPRGEQQLVLRRVGAGD